jgi:hypothetical protein
MLLIFTLYASHSIQAILRVDSSQNSPTCAISSVLKYSVIRPFRIASLVLRLALPRPCSTQGIKDLIVPRKNTPALPLIPLPLHMYRANTLLLPSSTSTRHSHHDSIRSRSRSLSVALAQESDARARRAGSGSTAGMKKNSFTRSAFSRRRVRSRKKGTRERRMMTGRRQPHNERTRHRLGLPRIVRTLV